MGRATRIKIRIVVIKIFFSLKQLLRINSLMLASHPILHTSSHRDKLATFLKRAPTLGQSRNFAHQIFRLQQTGQSGTTRLTLDLPDGEKLLVRFHVRRGQGMQVQFSTGSKGLKDSIRESWDNLKVEASQRGITLEEPEFEDLQTPLTLLISHRKTFKHIKPHPTTKYHDC